MNIADIFQFTNENPFILPTIYVLGGLLVGVLFHRIVIGKLKKVSEKTAWAWDDLIIDSLDKAPILWFLIIGAYLAILEIPINDYYRVVSWQILIIVFVLVTAVVLSKLAVGAIKLHAKSTNGIVPTTSIFTVLTKVLVYVLAGMVILQTFGISITPFLTALGVGGLAVALALQETLGNLFAGFQLIASNKFKPGDFIELEGGDNGYIEDINWRNTTIKTIGNNMVVLPNSKIAQAKLVNYSRPQSDMSLIVDCGVSYKSDLEKVEKAVSEVGSEIMEKVTGGVQGFEPFIRYHEFGDSSINFAVVLRVQDFVSQYLVKHEFIKALHKRFEKDGIEIPFPQRDVHMKNPS